MVSFFSLFWIVKRHLMNQTTAVSLEHTQFEPIWVLRLARASRRQRTDWVVEAMPHELRTTSARAWRRYKDAYGAIVRTFVGEPT